MSLVQRPSTQTKPAWQSSARKHASFGPAGSALPEQATARASSHSRGPRARPGRAGGKWGAVLCNGTLPGELPAVERRRPTARPIHTVTRA